MYTQKRRGGWNRNDAGLARGHHYLLDNLLVGRNHIDRGCRRSTREHNPEVNGHGTSTPSKSGGVSKWVCSTGEGYSPPGN